MSHLPLTSGTALEKMIVFLGTWSFVVPHLVPSFNLPGDENSLAIHPEAETFAHTESDKIQHCVQSDLRSYFISRLEF